MLEIVKTLDGTAAMLSLGGRLDFDGAPLFAAALNELEDSVTDLVLDLEGLDYISSCGLRQIVLAQKKMDERGSLTLIRLQPEVLEVLRMTGLAERLVIL